MITEAELSYEDMKQAEAKGYLCGKCQGRLVVAWSGEKNCYILRCGNDITHTGITRHDIKYEKRKKEIVSMDSTALTTMDKTTMLARINQAKFPQDLTPVDKDLLAVAAITYGFDPIMNEISIFQGRPFISIDGRYRKAQESNLLDGVETRPANKQEREDWSIPAEDYFFRSEVFVKGAGRPFVGWGRVFAKEALPGSRNDPKSTFKPVQSNPQRMAEKRAEAQALRKAFHIPLPSIEDIGSLDYDIDSTARVVDETTGEITEPKSPPKPKEKPEAKPEKATGTPPEAVTSMTQPVKEEDNTDYLDWLKEQMDLLESKGITAYSRANVLSYLNKITGQEDKKVSDAVKKLTKLQVENFTKKIQEAVEMS